MTQRTSKPKTRNPKPAVDPSPGTTTNTTPLKVDFSEVRTGEDTRQRGWFWHWNELHTEYEPLLKHSGVGLITSYIVWTDRREHSPYRGYAFPSLQSQAAFSGSDRAELITINRILVALDLIEIRKEMVLRVDEAGHKWRVPHNLYRVKDRSGDPHLTVADVDRVLRLADERKDVYRHIRHILTSGFVPISKTNVWHGILEDLRPTPLWQRLSAQATEEEARFSQRSRAGHAARKAASGETDAETGAGKGPKAVPEPVDDDEIYVPGTSAAPQQTPVTVDTVGSVESSLTNAAGSNTGLETSVAPSNEGLAGEPASMDGLSTGGRATSVAPSNPMYDQSRKTTSTRSEAYFADAQAQPGPVTETRDVVTGAVTSTPPGLSQVGYEHRPPEHGPDRNAAFLAFAEANDRSATAAESRLLAGIAAEINGDQGWAIVAAAIYEAVDSGSAFVAPKRVREIVRRWQREGFPDEIVGQVTGMVGGECVGGSLVGSRDVTAIARNGRGQAAAPTDDVDGQADDRIPNTEHQTPFWIEEARIGSERLWSAVVDQIERSGSARPAEVIDYLEPAVLLGRVGSRGFRIGVPHDLARQRIERKWRLDITEALGQVLGGSGWEIEVQVTGEHRKAG
jgi:hypothetical protein